MLISIVLSKILLEYLFKNYDLVKDQTVKNYDLRASFSHYGFMKK